jgi:acetyl esterase/lipase
VTDTVVERDLIYTVADGHELALDIHRPAGDGPAPVVVYLHGGGFQFGDKSVDTARLQAMTAEGFAVVSADYRLAPAARFPAPVLDARAALRWVKKNGANHDLATDRIAVWGASAGGYLAAMAALTSPADPLTSTDLTDPAAQPPNGLVDAVLVWFAPGDLALSARRSPLEAAVLPEPVETALFGAPVAEIADQLAAHSPVRRVHAAAPPFLIQVGDADRVVTEREARTLHDALVGCGADSTFTVLGGAGHEDLLFDTRSNIALAAAWLRQRLAPTPAPPNEDTQGATR